jgi:threonine/homoserine/homoserine lactone efflux protein
MPTVHDLIGFLLAGLLLNLTPGPDMALVIARATASGFRAGAAAALGVGAGCLVHITAAVLGLSAVLATSATAFVIVKLIGAAYLLYLGIALLRNAGKAVADNLTRNSADNVQQPPDAGNPHARIRWRNRLRAPFAQGFLTNVLNPKVALFFLAFLPQFIDSAAPDREWGLLLLGSLFTISGTLVNVAVAALVARAARGGVRRDAKASALACWLERALGALFIALAVRLALVRS